jgi:hypothetical protein
MTPPDFATVCGWLEADVEPRLAGDYRRERSVQRFAIIWATVDARTGAEHESPRRLIVPPPIMLGVDVSREATNLAYSRAIRKLAAATRAIAVAFVTMAKLADDGCVCIVLEHEHGRKMRRAVERPEGLSAFEDFVPPEGKSIEGCFHRFLPNRWMD